jgi:hypothetical protein
MQDAHQVDTIRNSTAKSARVDAGGTIMRKLLAAACVVAA